MVVIVSAKNEEDPIKNEGARGLTTLNIFFQTIKGSLLRNQWWYLVKIRTHIKVVRVTAKNEEDPAKIKALVTQYFFSPTQAQLYPQSVVGYGRI